MEFVHAANGIEARRLLSKEGMCERLDAMIVDEVLEDTTGLTLISQLAIEAPHAIRVLLTYEPDFPYSPTRLAELALDDAWRPPITGRGLVSKLLKRRPLLERTRAVHRRLDAQTAELEELEGRYYHARLARDRLARNVERALLTDKPHLDAMLWWWQGYREMLQHRVGLCPIDPEPLRLVDIISKALERQELQRWSFPKALPSNQRVWLDPCLVNRMTRCLLRGVLETGGVGAKVRWGRFRASGAFTTIQLRVEPVRREIENVEALLEDPFARMPDGPLRDLSIDLPLAHELLQSQGGRLEGVLTPPVLTVEWIMPRRCPDLLHPLAQPIRPIGNP
ncbi:MAG: hypothetical protein JJT88_10725 [Gammaproteobacteria bacterium]|nr:hypothetical protein [Gammaproteobacteria bacterium]